jgi:Zn-dependent M28 family amino/carboxypeptidase
MLFRLVERMVSAPLILWLLPLGGNAVHFVAEMPSTHLYAALGSEGALTEEMRSHRVGREGRWHIFHLPKGPSTIALPRSGDRRHAFSALIQLKDGAAVNSTFPVYQRAQSYANPLSERGQAAESAAASALTEAMVQSHYDGIVGIGDSSFQTRSFQNSQASRAAQEYLQAQFESVNVTTCLHQFGRSRGYTNVVGYIPGESSDTVTVGAHYDSRPFSGTAPGAEDNGSGVAALLSVLKALRSTSYAPRKHLYFVAFAAEEPGLVGSDHFASELQSGQPNVPAACRLPSSSLRGNQGQHSAIAIDEVGWRSPALSEPTVNIESYDWSREEVMEHLAQASSRINGNSLRVVHSSNPFGSDHMSWLDRSMPASLIINGDDEAYPNYHMSTDTMANVNVPYTASIARMVLGGAMRMAGAAGGSGLAQARADPKSWTQDTMDEEMQEKAQ